MATTAEDLVKAIAEARKSGETKLVAKLEKKLDALLDDEPPKPLTITPGSWIHDQDGLGEIAVAPSELPKRSKREIQLADDYFNEGAKLYAEDDARLDDMVSDLEILE